MLGQGALAVRRGLQRMGRVQDKVRRWVQRMYMWVDRRMWRGKRARTRMWMERGMRPLCPERSICNTGMSVTVTGEAPLAVKDELLSPWRRVGLWQLVCLGKGH